MPILIQIAIGGALGAILRHMVSLQITRFAGSGFPFGTFCINLLGSFLMGVLAALLLRRSDTGFSHFVPFLMTGILGGFTTFSAFSLEALVLFERGRPGLAILYAVGSVVAGLAAVFAGLWLFRPGSAA
jgi:CrcB protein